MSWTAVPGATYYQVSKSAGGSAYGELANNLPATTYSDAVALHLLDWDSVLYKVAACNSGGCTDSTAVRALPTAAIGYFKASNNSGMANHFGTSVALSADGTTMAVGAPYESGNATGVNGDQNSTTSFASGAVYVFVRNGAAWSQQAYIKASNTTALDRFGTALAISDDGNLLLVGAPGEDSNATGVDGLQSDNSASDSGAAYVFARTGAVWSQQSYLKASNTGASDSFGTSVALSGDGGTLAVGADLEDGGVAGVNGSQSNNNTPNSGAVYTFSRSGSTWVQQAYIKASNPGNNYEFGSPLAISNDGNTLAVGSPYEQSSSKGINGAQTDAGLYSAGAAYVFVRSGSLWTQQAYVKASNTEYGDSFATSLALDGAGSRLVVGAPHESGSVGGVGGDQSDNNLTGAGAAYVYDRTGSTWAQTLYVKASNPGLNDYFGYTVALSDNGNTMAIAAFEEDSAAVAIGGDQNSDNAPDAGAVYVFLRGNAGWMQKSYIKASNTSPVDRFGSSLALSGDGGRLVVGAVDEDSKASGIGGDQLNEEALESGAVYLY